MSNPKEFANFLLNNLPLTNDLFNFLVLPPDGKFYLNLGVSPLFRTQVTSPMALDVTLGEHRFRGLSDRPVLLVSHDPPNLVFGVDMVEIELRSTEKGIQFVEWYQRFEPAVATAASYKIEEGKLYQRQDNQWILIPLS